MGFFKRWSHLLIAIATIIVVFIGTGIIDVLLAFIYPRFYSNTLFIVLFGVSGIFAATVAYTTAINKAEVKDESSRWSLILLMIIGGLFMFFWLSKTEGGEYEAAFKAFGATLALGSLLFVRGKIDP